MAYNINVLIDDYADMNMRSKFVLNGIHEVASERKIPVRTFFSTDALLEALSNERRKIVITIAESKVRSEQLLKFFNENEIHPVFIHMQFSDYSYSYSSILPDYFLASYQLTMAVLSDCPAPSVFVGYNNDSFADKDRLNGFTRAADELKIKYDMYNNDSGIQKSLELTLANLRKYKNIICIGDVVGVPLINKMKINGINPADFNIASLRSMKIGEFSKPAITSISSDYFAEGMTAVDTYMLLTKKKYIQNLFVHTESRIFFRESTHLKKNSLMFTPTQKLSGTMVDFYGDDIVKEIDAIERMLINCDNVDMSIISGMVKGNTYEKISEINSMAVNTIKYRIKKMEHFLNVRKRDDFIKYIKNFDLNI